MTVSIKLGLHKELLRRIENMKIDREKAEGYGPVETLRLLNQVIDKVGFNFNIKFFTKMGEKQNSEQVELCSYIEMENLIGEKLYDIIITKDFKYWFSNAGDMASFLLAEEIKALETIKCFI